MMFNSCLFRECGTCWWAIPLEWVSEWSPNSHLLLWGFWLCKMWEIMSVCLMGLKCMMIWIQMFLRVATLQNWKTNKQTNNSISLLYLFAPKYSTYRLPSGLCEWASFVSLCGDYKLFGWFLQIWQLPLISDRHVFGKWLDLLKRAKKSFNWCSLYIFCHSSLFLYFSFVAL